MEDKDVVVVVVIVIVIVIVVVVVVIVVFVVFVVACLSQPDKAHFIDSSFFRLVGFWAREAGDE